MVHYSEAEAELLMQRSAVNRRQAATAKLSAARRGHGRNSSFALGRMKTGEMNRTEAAYAEYLEGLKRAGEVAWYRFEGLKLRLADATFYTPDFFVMASDGTLEAHEVKGFLTDDANVKIKVAADMYPIRFFVVRARAKKEGGGWSIQGVGNGLGEKETV